MSPSIISSQRLFVWTLLITFVIKLTLAIVFPLTGDEAFFYQWGQAPALGYADHPPMVGWWLAVLGLFSDQLWVARLAPVLLTVIVAYGLVDCLRRLLPPADQATAWWLGSIYLVMPWSWMLVLVTTDTPLIFFMSLSAWLFVRAETSESTSSVGAWYAASGLALGLAFLSKYFAVLLGLAYAVYILGWRRDRWWALMWIVAAALPAVIVHLYFNAYHGWQNIMFNLVNRHDQANWSLQTALVYVVMIAYLLTPWLIFHAFRSPTAVPPQTRRLFLVLIAVPLSLLLLVSLKRSVGLHWVLGFVPLFMVWAGLVQYKAQQLRRLFNWTLWLSIPHVVGVILLVGSPLSWWADAKLYDKLVFLRYASQVTNHLTANLPQNTMLMTTSYSPAAVLAYHHKQYVPVFGQGSHYARQDDLVVDFKALKGQNIRIFDRSAIRLEDYQPYFQSVQTQELHIHGATFYWLDGQGFLYDTYRRDILSQVVEQFHQIPPWLPILGNPFCERYGFAECSPPTHSLPNVRK